jgi:hypothetical protein
MAVPNDDNFVLSAYMIKARSLPSGGKDDDYYLST